MVIKKLLNKAACIKRDVRYSVEEIFYRMAGGRFDDQGYTTDPDNKEEKIYFGLLIYRIVCKNIYMIACLGVLGCAIALPFVSQLQSFLHLNHLVKLIFENNWHAIAKLTSVAVFSLLCTVAYLAQAIISTKKLSHAMNVEKEKRKVREVDEEECNTQRNYEDIVNEYPDDNHTDDDFEDRFSYKGILSNI
jgi:hypothetical protein